MHQQPVCKHQFFFVSFTHLLANFMPVEHAGLTFLNLLFIHRKDKAQSENMKLPLDFQANMPSFDLKGHLYSREKQFSHHSHFILGLDADIVILRVEWDTLV